MNRMIRIIGLLAGSWLCLHATTVLAEQTIVFKVPVQLANLSADVKKFSVGCTLRNKKDNPLANYAFGRTDLDVSKAYSGTVTVDVNVSDNAAAQVDSWDCTVYLFQSGQGCLPTFDATDSACRAKAGTQLVNKVEGTLAKASDQPANLKLAPNALPSQPKP